MKEYEAIIEQGKRNVLKAINNKDQFETKLLNYITEKELIYDVSIDENEKK